MEYVNGVGFDFDWSAVEGKVLTAELLHAGLGLTFMAEYREDAGVCISPACISWPAARRR